MRAKELKHFYMSKGFYMQNNDNSIPAVLMVDDKPENLILLKEMLEPLSLDLYVAFDGDEALKRISEKRFDLILLDVVMPLVDGYDVCKNVKSDIKTKDTPVVFISALNNIEEKIKGFEVGGDDYLIKPLVQKEVLARVKLHLQKNFLFKSLKDLLRHSYHELYNPLAIINSSVELQNIKHGSNSYMDSIMIASKRLQLIYEDIYYSLTIDKYNEAFIDIDLGEFVSQRILYFKLLSESKNLDIEFNRELDSTVEMRESDLLRIVDNTISNAIKYASDNTKVKIEVTSYPQEVVFMAQNSGPVIDNVENIFNQGYRERFDKIGMGIGLDVVASVCSIYNISTEVVSENETTMFKYGIPKTRIKIIN